MTTKTIVAAPLGTEATREVFALGRWQCDPELGGTDLPWTDHFLLAQEMWSALPTGSQGALEGHVGWTL